MENCAWLEQKNAEPPAFWKIDSNLYIIGRGETAQLRIASARVSREHAVIRRSPRGYSLEDLGSQNGTFVNGQPVLSIPRLLEEGDHIVLSGEYCLVFHDPNETTVGNRVGRVSGIWIDEPERVVWVDQQRLDPPLSAQQYKFLLMLYESAGQVITRGQMIRHLWPEDDPAYVSEEAVDGLIKRLRARLRENPGRQDYLEVLRGQGVRLNQPD